MNILYPDYSHSIVNLANSVLEYFGVSPLHTTLPEFDVLLKEGAPSGNPYKHIIVMVFDAMGSRNIADWLPPDSYLRSHLKAELTSTFPPTTTAATTSLQSAMTPAEHGWLGWRLYFSELGKNICLFMNTDDDRQLISKGQKYALKAIPYISVYDRIHKAGKAHAYSVSEFGTHRITTFDQLFAATKYICRRNEESYIYTYWAYPDAYMHREGICGIDTLAEVNHINSAVADLAEHVKDTLIIVTADHGQVNGTNELITNYPDINNCLLVSPAIEPRAVSFRLKPDIDRCQFETAFKKHFGKDFILMNHEEIISSGLFGNKVIRLDSEVPAEHPRFREFIGDYIAVSTGIRSIFRTPEEIRKFIGIHAGLLEKEMLVPFIAIRT